jgi:serine/threonine-protein kinase
MAPEQLAGQPAQPASDVYALGAVLYEMLAGRRPYPASTTDELARQQRLPAAPVEDAPPELVDLAVAALNFDAAARPSAAAVGRRLRAWQAGQAEAQTVFVPSVPSTAVVPAVAIAPGRSAAGRPSTIAIVAGLLVVVGLVAGLLALGATLNPAATTPVPAATAPASPLAVPTLTPTQAPADAAAGSGGGGGRSGGSDGGNRGDSGNGGGNGNGHGHDKDH